MKMLLCSDFSGIGYKFLDRFFPDMKHKKCLFVNYAQGDSEFIENTAFERLKSLGFEVDVLDENYDFSKPVDMIFVRGGNVAALLHRLHKFGQYEKLKDMVKAGVVYVGNSAGSILVRTTSFNLSNSAEIFSFCEK